MSAFELLAVDSPAAPRSEKRDQTELSFAIACLEGQRLISISGELYLEPSPLRMQAAWGYRPGGELQATPEEALHVAVNAIRSLKSDLEHMEECKARAMSDLRVNDSVRKRLEEETESRDRELGDSRRKMRAMESQHAAVTRRLQQEKDQLLRQLKEVKIRHQSELAKRARESEPSSNSRLVGTSSGASTRNMVEPQQTNIRVMVGDSISFFDVGLYFAHYLPQRLEIEDLRAAKDAAEARLEEILSSAEAIGFSSALETAEAVQATWPPRQAASARRVPMHDLSSGDDCSRWLADTAHLVDPDPWGAPANSSQLVAHAKVLRQMLKKQETASGCRVLRPPLPTAPH